MLSFSRRMNFPTFDLFSLRCVENAKTPDHSAIWQNDRGLYTQATWAVRSLLDNKPLRPILFTCGKVDHVYAAAQIVVKVH